jgi:hypothetical protein
MPNDYEIVPGPNNQEYVIVRCPRGHENQAVKVADVKTRQTLVCADPECKAEWTQILPQTHGLEQRRSW